MKGCLTHWNTIQKWPPALSYFILDIAENIQLVSETISKAYYSQMKQLGGRKNLSTELYPQIPVVYTGQWISPKLSDSSFLILQSFTI